MPSVGQNPDIPAILEERGYKKLGLDLKPLLAKLVAAPHLEVKFFTGPIDSNRMFEMNDKMPVMTIMNETVQTFRCSICCKVFRTLKEAKMHVDYVHFKLYQYLCKLCNSVFIRLKTARSHCYKRHANKTISEFLMNYPSDEGYKFIVTCHLEPDPPEQQSQVRLLKLPTAPVVVLKIKPAGTEALQQSLKHAPSSSTDLVHPDIERSDMLVTLEPSTRIQSGSVNQGEEAQKLRDPSLKKVQESNPCKSCGKKFKTDSSLQNHLKKFCPQRDKVPRDPRIDESVKKLDKDDPEFSPKTKFLCLICKKAFLSRTGAQTHVSTVHLKLTPFSCETCGKKFTQKQAMVKHQEKLHPKEEGAQPHQVKLQQEEESIVMCEMCGQVFPSIELMTEHIDQQHQS